MSFNTALFVGNFRGGGGGGCCVLAVKVASDQLTYTNAALVGKIPDINFWVFADNGSGTLLALNNGYSFNSGTGTVTNTGGGAWRVLMFNN